jgi:hypothetical protein
MNVPDESVLDIAGNRQIANPFGEGQQAPSVRQAAEALFKPTTDTPPATGEPSHRKPRILPVSPAAPARAEAETPLGPPNQRHMDSEATDPAKISTSDYGRVRVLAKYGMTLQQVAELYEVPLSEVMRIVRI